MHSQSKCKYNIHKLDNVFFKLRTSNIEQYRPIIMLDLKGKRVWVSGHRGMVGSAIVRRLENEGCRILVASRKELDLSRQKDVESWITSNLPEIVFLAAARVGGIEANRSMPANFIAENLSIASNVINAAYQHGVDKLLFLGSSCVYPRDSIQPIEEDALLSGPLEVTNQWYAIAKIAGIKLCQAYREQHGKDFISAMPTNLYGPGDNYHPEHSHVAAALLRNFHEARESDASATIVWGSGKPRREFMHVDDLADACIHLIKHYSGMDPINIGVGDDISINDFANLVAKVVGYNGSIIYNTDRPDGAPRKLLNITKLTNLGWKAKIGLESGLSSTYQDYLKNFC